MAVKAAQRLRNFATDVNILDGDGAVLTLVADDEIRARIGRSSEILDDDTGAKFTVTSGTPTAAGSVFTKEGGTITTQHRLRIDAADLDFDAGTYTLFFDLNDSTDGDDWKTVGREIFHLEDS